MANLATPVVGAAAAPVAPTPPPAMPNALSPAGPAKAVKAVKGYRLPGEGSSTLISLVTVALLFGAWWLTSHMRWLPTLVLPPPETVWNAFVDGLAGRLQGGKSLIEHFGWSFGRVFVAFWAAFLTAVPIGILMGVSRIARGVFDPPIEFYRPLPPLAYLPLVIIWFGIDEASKIILIYLACFAPLAVAARAGVKSVTVEQINAAASMGASRWQIVRHVILPAAMPEILTGMRIAIGFGWTTLVAAEMVAATAGLGQMVLNASNFLRTDVVIMGIFVIGIVAYVFDLMMRRVEVWLVPWKGKM